MWSLDYHQDNETNIRGRCFYVMNLIRSIPRTDEQLYPLDKMNNPFKTGQKNWNTFAPVKTQEAQEHMRRHPKPSVTMDI